jgi:superfamily I DNA/RNA helicase
LRSVGIDVSGRPFGLRKNYRNTFEILRAGYALVERHHHEEEDESAGVAPDAPEYAARHGERPAIISCPNLDDEVGAVSSLVRSLLAMGHVAGQICVISPSRQLREKIRDRLREQDVSVSDLRDDVEFESDNVKLSTIESSKGHEFSTVFIADLARAVIPAPDVPTDERWREASRLYVGMTRARDCLYLSYTGDPSPFLQDVSPFCDRATSDGWVQRKAPGTAPMTAV